jgi:hypothetical protein
VVEGDRPRLVFLGFGKYARSDRIYALQPLEADERGPGRRTLVWVEGIPNPIVASRSENAIVRDLGPGRLMVPSDLAQDALGLLRQLVDQLGRVGPLLRRQIRAEASLDLDELERRGRDVLERTTRAAGEADDALF